MNKIIILFFVGLFSIVSNAQNRVSEVKIEGNRKTKTSFLKRLALVKAQTALDSTKITGDIRRLKLSPSVANATYKVENISGNNYEVTYFIEENFTIIPGLNIATANNGEFAFRLSLFEFNFLGRNQLLGGFYSRDIFDSYGAFWEAPYLFNRKFGFGINYQNLVSQEPVFFENNNTVNYEFDTKAFEAKFMYESNFNNRFELGINISKEIYNFIQEEDVALPNEAPTALSANKVALISEYEYNTMDIDYQYQEGFKSVFTGRLVTGGNEFLKNTFVGRNDFEYFKRIGNKGNWANRLRLAFATNDETPFAPFAVDNQLNLRGVGNTIDRGTAAIVINSEYRQTLYEKGWFVLQSNAFIDFGSWRNPGGNISELFDGSTVRVYPGAGIRFIHKRIFNAVFRLDYGYGIGKNETNGIAFGIGQYF